MEYIQTAYSEERRVLRLIKKNLSLSLSISLSLSLFELPLLLVYIFKFQSSMVDEFRGSVEFGLKLSERLYYGKEPWMQPPKPPAIMDKSTENEYLPTAPMMYAVISDPSIVDNPDIPSYQPYVFGDCQPPALIPLHMQGIEVEVECYLDTAFVTVTGSWRVHCIAGNKRCGARIAIPVGDQGSVLGFEIEASSGSYETQLFKVEDAADLNGLIKAEHGGYLRPDIFTLKIPKVDGGSKILVKVRWTQKLVFSEGHFCLSLPFSFPAYVTPAGNISKREKIQLNVNCGAGKEVLCKAASHPLKELKRGVEKIDFLYEAEVDTWSQSHFKFSYTLPSSKIHGGFHVQSSSLKCFDQGEMFALYLFPGDSEEKRVFRKNVIFVVDISGSMKGAPFESVKKAVLASLSKLNHDDFFNIIAFNGETFMFSSSMELATLEVLQRASEWMNLKLTPEGDTNILHPMKQALEMVSNESNSAALIFLVTDGAVENERDVCNVVKSFTGRSGSPLLRISTFGIGSYCNHYFLQMLAEIGRGHYDSAYDADFVGHRLQRLYTRASSVILSNVEIECLNSAESLELYPSSIPDLSYDYPVILSGSYKGNLPESLKVRGTLADKSNFVMELKIQKAKDTPLEKVHARRRIDILTSKAWFTRSKEIEKQVAEISMKTGMPSEYTHMVLVPRDSKDQPLHSILMQGKEASKRSNLQKMMSSSSRKIIPLLSLGIGFGDLKRTAENYGPGIEVKEADTAELILETAKGCCSRVASRVCCLCFLRACSAMSNQCVITFSQICGALSCCECLDCCYDLCADCF